MESWIENAAAQVPALSVLVAMVWMFLRSFRAWQEHVEKTAESMKDAIEKLSNSYSDAAHECHAVQSRAIEAIGKNSAVLELTADAIKDLRARISDKAS